MTEPIIESISANIATTLAGVTVAAGYNQTLTVKRARRSDFDITGELDFTAILVQQDETEKESAPLCKTDRSINYEVAVLVRNDDRSTDAMDTRKNRVRADIEKILMIDPSRGGYAIDTVLQPPDNYKDGITVKFEVWYRTASNNPYNT